MSKRRIFLGLALRRERHIRSELEKQLEAARTERDLFEQIIKQYREQLKKINAPT